MKSLVSLKSLIIIVLSIGLYACSDNSNEKSKISEKENVNILANNTESIFEKDNDISPNMKLDKSIVGINSDRLQISLKLTGEDKKYSSLTRFAEITGNDSITQIKTGVFIDKFTINGQAMVQLGIELGYQSKDFRDNKTNLTIIQNVVKHVGNGFRMTGRAIGCKATDCTDFHETSAKNGNSTPASQTIVTRGERHILSIQWDDDAYRFVFSFDDINGYIDMYSFANEIDFNPQDFRYARLFATIENIKSDHDEGRVVVRFGNVYLNNNLYDDFNSETLDPEKWITSQSYR